VGSPTDVRFVALQTFDFELLQGIVLAGQELRFTAEEAKEHWGAISECVRAWKLAPVPAEPTLGAEPNVVTAERVVSALLKDPALTSGVAALLSWVATPWIQVDGGSERRSLFGRVIAKTYDHSRVDHPPLKPWKWAVWHGEPKEGNEAIIEAAQFDADQVLRSAGWTLA
jgi:hypothetical protein